MSKPLALSGNDDDDEIHHERSQSPPPALMAANSVESPLQSLVGDFRSALDEFRDNWQRELKHHSGRATPNGEVEPPKQQQEQGQEPQQQDQQHVSPNLSVDNTQDDAETAEQHTLAENLFRRAVELEQRGKVYDALPLYRKAIQIEPDIELKFHEHQKVKANNSEVNKAVSGGARPAAPVRDDTFDAEELIEDLYEKFQMDLARDCGGRLLLSNRDASVITTEAHISDLPPEIILYILRWVVSAQLDLRSLEQCAAVCKGLYLCARDEELWRLSCLKVWGVNLGTLGEALDKAPEDVIATEDTTPIVYNSWRQMYIERERVLFNGCYISKTTYLRMGENSFQDQYYRPVQLVEYYRYVRFLPDGTVLMMTTADEPAQGVTKLKQLQQLRPDVLRGHYRLYGSTITILLKKQQRIIGGGTHQYARQRRGSLATFNEEYNCTKYRIEFRIMNTAKRNFAQLIWIHYSVVQTRNKVETSSEFELTASKYPPLWFSPVRSYHLDADAPLA